jgi:hypothetical protein
MGVDEIELTELPAIDVENSRDDERTARTKSRPSVLDVPFADVEPYIVDIRHVIQDVGGTAAKIEHAIAGTSSKIGADDGALEGPGPDHALVSTKGDGHREHRSDPARSPGNRRLFNHR